MKTEVTPIDPNQHGWLQDLRPSQEVSQPPHHKKEQATLLSVSGSLIIHAAMFSALLLYSSKFIDIDQEAQPLEAFLLGPPEPVQLLEPKLSPPPPQPTSAPTPAPTPAPTKPPKIEIPNPKSAPTPKLTTPTPAPTEHTTPAPTAEPPPVSEPVAARIATKPAIDARYSQSNPKPEYPTMARRLGQQGTVTLEITVGSEGKAKKVRVAQSSGHQSLDEAAAAAISKWRFVPATINGEPVEQTLLTRWTYKLN